MPMWIIFKKELNQSVTQKQFWVFYVIFTGITLLINLNVYRSLSAQLVSIQPDIAQRMLEGMLGRVAIFAGFIIVASMFANILREKSDRIIEVLLCYPISPTSLLYAKAFAILLVYTISSYSIALLLYVGACIVEGGFMALSLSAIMTVIIAPVVLGLGIFTFNCTLLLGTSVAGIGQRIIFICFFLCYFFGARAGTSGNLWAFLLTYIVAGLVFFAIAVLLQKKYLTKERLILC